MPDHHPQGRSASGIYRSTTGNGMTQSDLTSQIERIKSLRKKRKLSSSRLNRDLYEILELRLLYEASYADIALWLRTHRRIKVTRQAVGQFINRHLATLDSPNKDMSNG